MTQAATTLSDAPLHKLAKRLESPYDNRMANLHEYFRNRFQNMLNYINKKHTFSDNYLLGFLIEATFELTPVLTTQENLDNYIQRVGNFLLLSSIPLAELASARTPPPMGKSYARPNDFDPIKKLKILPKKCADLITIIANSTPTEIREEIFGKDFRQITSNDLKTLYDLATDDKERKHIIQTAAGIAYAQALTEDVWRPSHPASPKPNNQTIAAQKLSKPILTPEPHMHNRAGNVIFAGILTHEEYLALAALSKITSTDPTIIPTAQRSLSTLGSWPKQSSVDDALRTRRTLAIHPRAIQLLQNTAALLRENPSLTMQWRHINTTLNAARNTPPYYCGTLDRPPNKPNIFLRALNRLTG